MSSESFLQQIYQGRFSKEGLFDSSKPSHDPEKIAAIIEAYGELLERYPPNVIEALGRIPPDMLHEMAQIGLFGLSIPVAYGGLDFGIREYMRVVEGMVALDMATALTSLAHLAIGVKGIELFGDDAQKQKYLIPAAAGRMIFSYALTEPRIGSDAQNIQTRAELLPDGEHYLLNGQKTYITNANYAGALVVFARMEPTRPGFMGAFIVETGWAGVKIGKDMPKMGLKASSTAAIQFREVRVPVSNLLGKPGDGFKIAMTILNFGRLALGAASLGMMRQSLEDMHKRASTRLQFGVPIGEFPLIREKLAKAEVNRFTCAAINDFTASIMERSPTSNLAAETSHCKLFGTTRAWETLYDAFQVAGGSAYLATNPYEKRLRDFRVATVFEGTTEIHTIYPALSAVRVLSKIIRLKKEEKSSVFGYWLRSFFSRVEWPLEFGNRTLQKASRFARSNADTIRRMLLFALLIYRTETSRRQFLLRRITTLSLYLYAMTAVLTRLSSKEKAGLLEKEDILRVRYLLEEAKESRRINKRLFDTEREKLTDPLSKALFR